MTNTVYKVVHFQPFEGYEILGEFDTEEAAEACKAQLLEMAPQEILTIARVPRVVNEQPAAAESEKNNV